MADFVTYDIPAGVWTKVASGAVQGSVQPLEKVGRYLQVVKSFGSAAPTDADLNGAKEVPYAGGLIKSSERIDVYFTVTNITTGKVRVDP